MARAERKAGGALTHLCRMSFVEIYNERIYDLLDADAAAGGALLRSLQLRESLERGVFVDGQVEVTVRSPADALRVMARGCANRHVGSTLMNRTSSRSHSVFTLWVEAR